MRRATVPIRRDEKIGSPDRFAMRMIEPFIVFFNNEFRASVPPCEKFLLIHNSLFSTQHSWLLHFLKKVVTTQEHNTIEQA